MWAVAVTTAPRHPSTLTECLESIVNCGWYPTVFAEPGSTQTEYPTIQNEVQLGVWHNWLSSCRWVLDNTNAELILTSQDDSYYHPDSKDYIESIDWPNNAGFISLYTPKHYSKKSGLYRVYTRSLWGACALVWQRNVLDQVINHPIALSWKGAPPRSRNKGVYATRLANPHTIANSDTAIGKILNNLKLGMYFVDPSPVSHIAVTSTIGHGGNRGRRNAKRLADHSIPLIHQLT